MRLLPTHVSRIHSPLKGDKGVNHQINNNHSDSSSALLNHIHRSHHNTSLAAMPTPLRAFILSSSSLLSWRAFCPAVSVAATAAFALLTCMVSSNQPLRTMASRSVPAGRSTPEQLSNKHFVLGTPLLPPFPDVSASAATAVSAFVLFLCVAATTTDGASYYCCCCLKNDGIFPKPLVGWLLCEILSSACCNSNDTRCIFDCWDISLSTWTFAAVPHHRTFLLVELVSHFRNFDLSWKKKWVETRTRTI